MKIRRLNKKAIRKAKREERMRQAKQEYKERIAKWHKKFVIWPRELHTPNDDAQYKTVAFFETIWQKGRVVTNIGPYNTERVIWTRLTDKDYFMQKLDGTLPPEERFDDFGVDMASASTPSMTGSTFSSGK